MSLRARDLRSEDGGVLVTAAIVMVALVFMGIAVIQVGAWFHNRRDIQKRADGGAFAAAQLFNECFDTGSFPSGALPDMQEWAKRYSGFASTVGAPVNQQIGTGTGSYAFQSPTYPGGTGPGPDDTYTGNTDPCNAANIAAAGGGFDVKLKQDAITGLFSISPLATVYGHARVQIKEAQSIVPSFPLAVPEIVPGAVGVTFVNEDTNSELTQCSGTALVANTTCTFRLTNSSAPGTDPFNLGPWIASGQTIDLPAFAASGDPPVTHIGMRVGVGDAVRSCVGAGNGTTWQCYNADPSNLNHGAVMIAETNPNQGTPSLTNPKLIGVWTSTCSGSPFAGDTSLPSPCGGTVSAKIDFGSTCPAAATIQATLNNSNGNQTFTLGSCSNNVWSAPLSSSAIAVESATGGSEYSVDLSWKTGPGNSNRGSWTGVQRAVGATNSDDGPLATVSLTDATAPLAAYTYVGATSVTAHALDIAVKLQAPFDKLTILREAHSGSATSFILCRWKNNQVGVLDSGQNSLSDSMNLGCQVPYQVNSTTSCNPDPLPSPQNVTNPDCTQNKPCDTCGNTISTALDTRFGCVNNQTPAHPNLWPNYSTPGDPRAVTLVTTSFGAFQANGSNTYPVTGFGAFYIAGVSGNSCGDTWPAALGPAPNQNSGTIWGYFIKYANNDGTPSGRACQLNSLNNCVAVLTR